MTEIQQEYIKDDWACPEEECNAEGMTAWQFRNHGIEEHPESVPFTDMFPQYLVCGSGVDGDGNLTEVYMKAESENGPYYMAWEDRDYIDEMHPWELYRHDWERVQREETPFPRFER